MEIVDEAEVGDNRRNEPSHMSWQTYSCRGFRRSWRTDTTIGGIGIGLIGNCRSKGQIGRPKSSGNTLLGTGLACERSWMVFRQAMASVMELDLQREFLRWENVEEPGKELAHGRLI